MFQVVVLEVEEGVEGELIQKNFWVMVQGVLCLGDIIFVDQGMVVFGIVVLKLFFEVLLIVQLLWGLIGFIFLVVYGV